MSIERKVVLRNEVYSSEQQERMAVYFELNEEFRKCMARCPRVDNLSEAQCEKRCERIYDEYVDKLKTRYEGVNKDKLNEVISGAESFTTKPREDRQGLLYKIFHW